MPFAPHTLTFPYIVRFIESKNSKGLFVRSVNRWAMAHPWYTYSILVSQSLTKRPLFPITIIFLASFLLIAWNSSFLSSPSPYFGKPPPALRSLQDDINNSSLGVRSSPLD